jgi:hypothetical protein
METLLSSIVAIAAIDSINPNAVAVQIYLLSTPKPIDLLRNSAQAANFNSSRSSPALRLTRRPKRFLRFRS